MAFWEKPKSSPPAPAVGVSHPPAPVAPAAPRPTDPPAHKESSMALTARREEDMVRPSGELNALLGRGSEFEGKLTFEGTVRIDGKFKGEINTSDTLVVGEGARVDAEITCGTLIVHGEINGNCRARVGMELHNPARVKGNLATPALTIDKGVIFEGNCKMEGLESANVTPIKAADKKSS